MRFFWQPGEKYEYSEILITKAKSKEYVLELISKFAAQGVYPVILVNTHVDGSFLNKKYFPFLDCDSWNDMIAAKHWIKSHYGLNSVEIESSPGKFWVIVDKMMGLKEARSIILTTPGVDENYQVYIKHYRRGYKCILVRACPKENGYIPDFRQIDKITHPLILKWAKELKHWYEEELLPARKALELAKSLKDGTFHEHMANPGFVV